jgi:hypothetical protein
LQRRRSHQGSQSLWGACFESKLQEVWPFNLPRVPLFSSWLERATFVGHIFSFCDYAAELAEDVVEDIMAADEVVIAVATGPLATFPART